MKIYPFNVASPYREFILEGKKTFEWRLNKWKFQKIHLGDILEFEDTKEQFLIKSKNIFATFQEMIEFCGIENIIPDKEDILDAVNVYYKFYTPEQEKEFGVVAIEIEKVF